LTAHQQPLSAVEGTAVAQLLVATFTDANPNPDLADYSAAVDWGDGDTTAGISIQADQVTPGQFDVYATKSLPYAEEASYTVSVTLHDAGGAETSVNDSIVISDAALTLTQFLPPAPVVNVPITNANLATFSDADIGGSLSDYT